MASRTVPGRRRYSVIGEYVNLIEKYYWSQEVECLKKVATMVGKDVHFVLPENYLKFRNPLIV